MISATLALRSRAVKSSAGRTYLTTVQSTQHLLHISVTVRQALVDQVAEGTPGREEVSDALDDILAAGTAAADMNGCRDAVGAEVEEGAARLPRRRRERGGRSRSRGAPDCLDGRAGVRLKGSKARALIMPVAGRAELRFQPRKNPEIAVHAVRPIHAVLLPDGRGEESGRTTLHIRALPFPLIGLGGLQFSASLSHELLPRGNLGPLGRIRSLDPTAPPPSRRRGVAVSSRHGTSGDGQNMGALQLDCNVV